MNDDIWQIYMDWYLGIATSFGPQRYSGNDAIRCAIALGRAHGHGSARQEPLSRRELAQRTAELCEEVPLERSNLAMPATEP